MSTINKEAQSVIDLIVKYDRIVADAKAEEDGEDTYEWDEGIAP